MDAGAFRGGGGKRGNFPRAPRSTTVIKSEHLKKEFFRHVINHILYIHSISKKILNMEKTSKDLPNINTFCDWLSVTIVISVYDTFFRNDISIVLLSFIVLTSQSQRLFL